MNGDGDIREKKVVVDFLQLSLLVFGVESPCDLFFHF